MTRRKRALVDNATDEAQIDDAKRRAKLDRDQELADLRAVLALPAGARFLWRFLSRCHLFELSLRAGEASAFLEGERNIGLFLLAECELARPTRTSTSRHSLSSRI
jgi:hypothetical protein